MQKRFCLLLTLGTLIMSATGASAFGLDELSAALTQSPMSTGRFVQEKELSGFPKPMRTEGIYYLDVHKGIVWETRKPFMSTMVFSKQGLNIRTAQGEKSLSAKEIPYLKTINEIIVSVLSARMDALKSDFEIRLAGDRRQWTITLVTRPESALKAAFNTMRIEGDRVARTITMQNAKNEKTVLYLSEQKAMAKWPKHLDSL